MAMKTKTHNRRRRQAGRRVEQDVPKSWGSRRTAPAPAPRPSQSGSSVSREIGYYVGSSYCMR